MAKEPQTELHESMRNLRLNGIEVTASGLTQRRFRAAYCNLLLNVTNTNKAAALAAFRKAGELGAFSGLRLSGINDLSFLKEFPLLLYLEIKDQKDVDTRHLDCLNNLRGLHVESPGKALDFACFPELEVFSGDWHAENCNLGQSQELRMLRLWHFNPRSADVSQLANITRLEHLHIIQTNIQSLAGLETLDDLRYLMAAYAPKLETLSALASGASGIREFELDRAKRIESYRPIAAVSHLRRLLISSSASMQDLKWTAGMEHLDFFSFVDTDVVDGDLSPLLDLPRLRYVGTMDKRHYNYKGDALNGLLGQRELKR